ncbi:hypothetical protein EB796_018342 [Bugula neritina]|uniref:Uncharacterized protein n=1 Tax=Bugula neritina TaxID=10212 RepID=A0A7J7JD97_BUGNE|nr:hypothetical protein EB796_018342 [Bugula neritina]
MSLPVDGLAIHPELIKKLKNAKISKLEDVLVKGSADLQKATQISAAKIENIKEQACNLLYPIKVISAWDCLKSAYQKLPTGCDSIDRALNGGILSGNN